LDGRIRFLKEGANSDVAIFLVNINFIRCHLNEVILCLSKLFSYAYQELALVIKLTQTGFGFRVHPKRTVRWVEMN